MNKSYATKALIMGLLLVAAQAFVSCRGNQGPMGPPGYDGKDGQGFYMNTLFYIIYPNDWKPIAGYDDRWIDSRYSTLITQNVIDNGSVLFYLRSFTGDDYWTQMPFTTVEYDKGGNVFSTEIKAWYGLSTLELELYDSHPNEPLAPDMDYEIKIVVVEGSTAFIDKFKKMDHSDYDAVMKMLGQENANAGHQ